MSIDDRDYMRERTRQRISGRAGRRRIGKTGQWIIWAIFFFPMMILANGAMKTWGFLPVMALLVAMLIASLLAARYIGGRSWDSIMWGDRD